MDTEYVKMKLDEKVSLTIIVVVGTILPIILYHNGMARAAYTLVALAGGWSCYILIDKVRGIKWLEPIES